MADQAGEESGPIDDCKWEQDVAFRREEMDIKRADQRVCEKECEQEFAFRREGMDPKRADQRVREREADPARR